MESSRRSAKMPLPTAPAQRITLTITQNARVTVTLAVMVAVVSVLVSGCGGYYTKTERLHEALKRGSLESALSEINRELGVEHTSELPASDDPDLPLLLLERAMVLHALGRYRLSARDLGHADSNLEVIDLTRDTAGDIAKYVFSDDARLYKASPHEKLLVNTLNMLNYLALGDLPGAMVEARRLTVIEKFLADSEEKRSLTALGAYLAGFAHEHSGAYREAMRYYAEALERGGVPGIEEAIRSLYFRTGATDPALDRFYEGLTVSPSPVAEPSEVLIVVHNGVAPRKEPVRMPIGAALASLSRDGRYSLSRGERVRAETLAAQGTLKWLNYPGLRRRVSKFGKNVVARVDGRPVPCKLSLDVEAKVLEAFEKERGALVVAAITRMLARATAGAVAGSLTKKLAGSSGLGLLVQLGTEGALIAADTPDTRSWSTLPARIYLSRLTLPPGRHSIDVEAFGPGGVFRKSVNVELPPSGFKVVSVATLR